jgi:hypothetical protein
MSGTLKLVQAARRSGEGPGGRRRAITFGFAGLAARARNGQPGTASPAQAASDGDTVSVRALANIGTRFLGVDAPETKTPVPDADGPRDLPFLAVDHPEVAAFLDNPFDAARYGAFPEPANEAEEAFLDHLRGRVGQGGGAALAANHRQHAKAAEAALEAMLEEDCRDFFGGDEAAMVFHLAYGSEVLDRYGRLLAFLNARVEDADRRKPEYNERLAMAGFTQPYFIWPNIQPFLGLDLLDAVPSPAELPQWIAAPQGRKLREARQAVAAARAAGDGIFDPADGLRLAASELRLLTGRRLPDRYVIDLSRPGTDQLMHPCRYHEIPHEEDRLFIPRGFASLFAARGWKLPA